MCVRVFCVLMLLGLSAAQDQEDVDTVTDGTEVDAVSSAAICSACECSEGVLDCSKKNLLNSFNNDEWDELKPLNIKAVDLSGNSIEHLSVKSELPIETFNASNNRIESIEDWCFEYLENLTTLDLSRNELADLNKRVFWGHLLPDAKIRSFAKMRYLSLAYNDLHVIPRDAFAFMHGLTFLDLSRNPLAIIDQVTMGTLSELTAMRELRMSACGLETLPDGLFRTQRKLERLDLSNNKFTTVPAVIGEATNLVYLNFDRNPITTLIEKTSISSLAKLRELRLCNTKLQTIGPGALGGLEKLEVLYICNNPKLSVIDEDFLTWEDDDGTEIWPALKEIYLYNNNMSEVDPDFLFRWDQLTGLSFVDNPFVCDCRNQWMVDVLVPLITSVNGTAADMICTKPQDVRGLSFAQLFENSKTLVCAEAEDVKALPGPDMAIILGVMIGIFVTFPLVLIIVLLWKKGYYAKCRRKINSDRDSDEENDAF